MLIDTLNGISTMPITIAYQGKGNYCTRYIKLVPFIELGASTINSNRVTLNGEKIEYTMPVKTGEFKWHIIYGLEKALPMIEDHHKLELTEENMQFCINFSARAMKEIWLKMFLKEKHEKLKLITNYKGSTWVGFDDDCNPKQRTEICVVVTTNNQMSLNLSPEHQKNMFSLVNDYFEWITDNFWYLFEKEKK